MHSFSNVKCVSRVFRVELRKLIPDILVKHYTMSLLWMEWMMIVQILDWIREGEVPGSIIRKLFPDSVIIGRVLRSVWWPEPSSSPPPAPAVPVISVIILIISDVYWGNYLCRAQPRSGAAQTNCNICNMWTACRKEISQVFCTFGLQLKKFVYKRDISVSLRI